MQAITALGLSCLVDIVNDGVNSLISGTAHGIGVNVTAGSSNNCRGRGKNGKEGRIVGNGPTFGEFGGGMEIVLKALHMVNYAWIRRIPPTALTGVLLNGTGAKDEMDLMEVLSHDYYHLFPHVALEVINTARTGDPAACEVIEWAGEELGWLYPSRGRLTCRMKKSKSCSPAPSLRRAPSHRSHAGVVLKHVPRAKLLRLDGPPVVGPLMLGMEMAGIDPYPMRRNLIRTAKHIVK